MAVISTLKKGSGGVAKTQQDDFVAYKTEFVLDFADALVAKGSALAATDIIQTIVVPTGFVLLNAGIQKMSTIDATTLTVNLGITDAGGLGSEDVDEFVAAWDAKAASNGAYTPQLASAPTWFISTAEDTLDVALATLTGTLTSGKLRIWAILCPVYAANKDVGIARVGS